MLRPPLSGVGIYLEEILKRLPFEIERRGLPSGMPGAKRASVLRRVPGAYRLRQLRLGWPLSTDPFWAPNFILPPTRGPSVITVHDTIFLDHPQWADRDRGAFLRSALASSLRRAAAIVVSTEEARARLGHPNKTHVIRPGVRQLRGSPGPEFVVVGNIEPRKDPWTVLKAHRALPRALRRQRPLLFVGAVLDASYAHAFLQALDPPYSRYLGRLPDAEIYRGTVIAPALAEGFGFVPLEAYAAGIPVIARDLTVTRENLGNRIRYFSTQQALTEEMQRDQPMPAPVAITSWEEAAKRYAQLFLEIAR